MKTESSDNARLRAEAMALLESVPALAQLARDPNPLRYSQFAVEEIEILRAFRQVLGPPVYDSRLVGDTYEKFLVAFQYKDVRYWLQFENGQMTLSESMPNKSVESSPS